MADEAKPAEEPAAAPAPAAPKEGEPAPAKKGIVLTPKLMIAAGGVLVVLLGVIGFLLFSGKKTEVAEGGAEAAVEKHQAPEEGAEGVKEERTAAPPVEEGAAEKAPKEEKHGKEEKGGKEEGKHGAEGGGEFVFKFDSIVVNIFEKNSIHFLKLGLEAACSNAEVMEELKVKKSPLQDKLLFIAGDTTLREISTAGGKALLKEDIIAAFNKVLKSGKILELYFTEFTIQ